MAEDSQASNKRKLDEIVPTLSGTEARDKAQKYLPLMGNQQLIGIILNIVEAHPDLLDGILDVVNKDQVHRRLFVRGVGYETSEESVRQVFSKYGEIEECSIIIDRMTGRGKGYGFVMYKTAEGASKALEEPSKEIDGRQVRCNLAAEGALNSGSKDKNTSSAITGAAVTGDGQNRKVFFKSLDFNTSQDTVRSICSTYGEVEHIQMKIDAAGRSNGMATVTFSTVGAASDCVRLCPRDIEGRRVQIQFSNPPPQQGSGQQQYTYAPHNTLANPSMAATMINPIAALNPTMMSAAMTTLPPQQQQQIQQQFLQQQQQYQQLQQQQQQQQLQQLQAQGMMRR